MRRVTGLVSAAAIVMLAAGVYAHATDFSGKWTVDAEKTAAANPNAAPAGRGGQQMGGGAITNITQDAKTITIARMGADGTAMGAPAVYNLDGSDSKITMAGRGGAAGTEVVAKAKWDGATLVITTTTAGGDQVAKYSMDGADIKIETTRPGRNGGAPTTATQFLKKAM